MGSDSHPALKLPASVVALVTRASGEVLTVTRRGCPAELCLPGGTVEPGELPNAAVLRELREETGIMAFAADVVHAAPGQFVPLVWVYFVESYIGTPRQMEEGIGVQWLPLERLCEDRQPFRDFYRGLVSSLAARGFRRVSERLPP